MYDVIVIGSGIIGVSSAWQIKKRNPNLRILILEKESGAGLHQSSHNSGVVHAGVYYEPESLKAKFCIQGNKLIKQFCKDHNLPLLNPGKLIIATNSNELENLEHIIERCTINNIDFEIIEKDDLTKLENNITGLKAVLIKETAIVDYQQILLKMLDLYTKEDGKINYNQEIINIEESDSLINIQTQRNHFRTRYLVSCAGLISDRIAGLINPKTNFQIIPFRGEYYKLNDKKSNLVKHLIYPVPNQNLPFLGVHITPMIDGSITVGPNAILGLKREAYHKSDINLGDIISMIRFAGFWRLILRYYKTGFFELRNSLIKSFYIKEIQKFCPSIELDDLEEWPSGVRAQAVDRSGNLLNDFLIEESKRSLLVCNAPSPGATSSIPIGKYITDRLFEKMTKSDIS